MTTWTPESGTELAWAPVAPDAVLQVVDSTLTVPIVLNTNSAFVVDFSTNIIGGRPPYVFSVEPSGTHLPDDAILEADTGRLLFPKAGSGETSEQFYASVVVHDANRQLATFQFNTAEAAGPIVIETNPAVVGGYFPDAHGGTEELYILQFLVSGGIPPITLTFTGLNLGALGFTFDGAVTHGIATLYGAYDGSLGDSLDNLVLIRAYNAGNPVGGAPDGELGVLWNLFAV